MKRNKDWTDVVRERLRNVESAPPAGGWNRLERELVAGGPFAPAASDARGTFRAVHRRRIFAAAAAIVLCIVAGEYAWRGSLGGTSTDERIVPGMSGFDAASGDLYGAAHTREIAAVSLPGEPEAVASQRGDSGPAAGGAVRQSAEGQAVRPIPADADSESVPGRGADSSESDADAAAAPDVAAGDADLLQTAESSRSSREEPAAGEKDPSAPTISERAAASAHSVRSCAGDRTLPGEKADAGPMRDRRFSWSLHGSGGFSDRSRPGATGSFSDLGIITGEQAVERYTDVRNTFRHHQPLGFGLTVRRELPHGLSLETGLSYTLLRSDVLYWPHHRKERQILHFIGIPVRMNWQFLERGRFFLYIGAGGMLEKCVAAKLGGRSVDEPAWQWSLSGAVGAQYRLGRVVGLYFEPEISRYFTETRLRTVRTDDPLVLTLRLGVRFSF